MRRLFGVAALSLSLFGAAAAVSSSVVEAAVPDVGKIAVVDMQRILNETAAGKKARKDLETASAAKQKKLDKLQKKLEEDQKALSQIKDEQTAQQAAEKLQRDYYELQTMYMTLQQELAEQEARTLEKMYSNCQALAKELAKDFSLDLVLIRDQSTVLYAAGGIDLTDEVIKRYDKKYQ
ncbi:MAG TPA: OmpH family outer membrane protein [Enhygromyxa sp.]|nr:OmpH family outer membrane protein [Enhygromyxa sp.]